MATKTRITVHATAERAQRALPAELHIGPAVLHLSEGEGASRWSNGSLRGAATIHISKRSRSSSEIELSLEAPEGLFARLGWFLQGPRRFAGLFAQALRYEVETRGAEDADAFATRRTSKSLIKQRSA